MIRADFVSLINVFRLLWFLIYLFSFIFFFSLLFIYILLRCMLFLFLFLFNFFFLLLLFIHLSLCFDILLHRLLSLRLLWVVTGFRFLRFKLLRLLFRATFNASLALSALHRTFKGRFHLAALLGGHGDRLLVCCHRGIFITWCLCNGLLILLFWWICHLIFVYLLCTRDPLHSDFLFVFVVQVFKLDLWVEHLSVFNGLVFFPGRKSRCMISFVLSLDFLSRCFIEVLVQQAHFH